MKMWHFVAGIQHVQAKSRNVLDAWLQVERMKERGELPSEFWEDKLPIEAYDQDGSLIRTQRYSAWHRDLMRDTYGENWQEALEQAQEKSR